jgi:4,5-dihydroxyphthalate decarboxylase
VVVVRAELLRRHPWVALNVFAAFTEAKRLAFADLSQRSAEIASAGGLLEPWVQIGAVPQSVVDAIRRVDPLPYGLRGQQPVLRALSLYLAEQGLTTSVIDIGELFAPTTRDL